MADAIDFEKYIFEKLKDSEVAMGYLNAALEDEDVRFFLLAIRHSVKAQGGISPLSLKTKLSRKTLFKFLSIGENPPLKSTQKILKALGFSIQIHATR